MSVTPNEPYIYIYLRDADVAIELRAAIYAGASVL